MIRVLCPHCKRRYRTVTEAMGRQAVCHNCHITFEIGQERPPFQWKQTDLAEDSWIGVAPPEAREELKHCVMCDAPLEPGAVRCPACGANQVTGLVHRGRRQPKGDERASVLQMIPWRLLIAIAGVGLVAYVTYLGISAVHRSATVVGEDLVDQNLVNKAVRFLQESGDEYDFAREFAGQVNDENLPRLMSRLGARDPQIRRAAVRLIGHGRYTQIGRLVAEAESGGPVSPAREVLAVMGARRLVELSCDSDEGVRQSAAKGLVLLFNPPNGEATLSELASLTTPEAKTAVLNQLCRPWPQAVGYFRAVANEQICTAKVLVEQVGRTFYVRVGAMEFRSPAGGARSFEIPIEHWCAATGQAVDVAGLRKLIAGLVALESPSGDGWAGTIRLTVKQELAADLPGFLPFTLPERGQTVEVPIRLERIRS